MSGNKFDCWDGFDDIWNVLVYNNPIIDFICNNPLTEFLVNTIESFFEKIVEKIDNKIE